MLNLKTIKITPEILKLISEIDEFKGGWNALERHTTDLQLLGDVADFGQNFSAILEPWQNKPFSEEIIKTLHKVVMGKKGGGEYKVKEFPLIIQNGNKIIGSLDTASVEDAGVLMSKLVPWVDEILQNHRAHPLLVIALFTAVFLQVCPFDTGNQRLARLLIVLLMFRSGYAYAPYAALEPLMNEYANEYFGALSYTQETLEAGKPDWDRWFLFFLRLLKEQKLTLEMRIDARGDQITDMPALSGKVLKLFDNHARLSMKEIERLTRGRRSTLKLRLGELVSGGYLQRHGQARSTWYSKV